MKNKSTIYLIILILLLACSKTDNKKVSSIIHFDSGFSLSQDTITVDIKGEMTHALKYQDKYYVLFKKRVLKYGGSGQRWLYIFSNGQVEKIVDCPIEMKTVYLDFYAKNDSLILKPYMDKQSYYLDLETCNWMKIDKTDDLIFEDDKFQVFSLNFGEWGGKTWFKEKNTGQEYVIESNTPLVNKLDSTYYLTNSFKVLKVRNPKLLNKCSDDITYENIISTGKSHSWYGKPIGFDFVYRDTTSNFYNFNYKPHIVSSFVLDKELLHIYETDTAAYIARHKDYSIHPIQKIAENIRFYNWSYSYRCPNLNGNNELLKFRTTNKKIFGLLEIIESEIYIKYFNNIALLEPKPLGTKKADSIFVDRLNAILPELYDLKLNTIDSLERAWGSFDITPNHNIGIGNNWNPNNYTLDSCRSYLVKEDSIVSNTIIYHGTKENNLVRVISMHWQYVSNPIKTDSKEYTKKMFDIKAEYLIDYVSENIGKQIENDDEKNYIKRTWETPDGMILNLSYNPQYYMIRLVIYEKKN